MSSDASVLPPAYKKRIAQGIGAWFFLVILVAIWVWQGATETQKFIDAETLHAQIPITRDGIQVDTPGARRKAHAIPKDITYKVALIMSELGLSYKKTKHALDALPSAVTLAFLPYNSLKDWIKMAREAGHDALTLLPMEPDLYPRHDPGPQALLTGVSDVKNIQTLENILRRSNGAAGVMNYMGGAFLADDAHLAPVFKLLGSSGAVFVEHSDTPRKKVKTIAENNGLPHLKTDIKIDTIAKEKDIHRQLLALESLAKQKGYAIGIATPYPVTFQAINNWIKTLPERGGALVPLSKLDTSQKK